jgi:preprotein translocase subunit SecY
MLAGAVVVIHFLIVLFVVAGVPLIYVGAARGWAWVRRWPWRLLHLGAIFVIAAESVLGIACPLTIWEDRLRGRPIATGFIERWIDRLLFYEAPAWVFTAAYVAFAALVLLTWVAVPPAKDAREP